MEALTQQDYKSGQATHRQASQSQRNEHTYQPEQLPTLTEQSRYRAEKDEIDQADHK
jgi:hypothetical protein